MRDTQTSPFPTEKRNVVYTSLGAGSGSAANKALQKMLASASNGTPSVAACGATTVWANGPMAPPFLNRTDSKKSLPICVLDMIGNRVGFMAGP